MRKTVAVPFVNFQTPRICRVNARIRRKCDFLMQTRKVSEIPIPVTPPSPSKRSASIKSFHVLRVVQSANKLQKENPSKKVLRLEIGQPSTAPPSEALNAATRSLALNSSQGYTPSPGLPALREALSDHYQSTYDLPVRAKSILITAGSSPAFTALFAALFDPGDRVAILSPSYPCYNNVLSALSVVPVPIPVSIATNYNPTVAQLAAVHAKSPLRALLLASPANPTGAVLTDTQLASLAAFCKQHGILLISDEVYHGLTRRPVPTAAQYNYGIVLGSFSKFWCMPGFRVGWVVVPDDRLRDAVEHALQNMAICAPAVSQHAALAALDEKCRPAMEKLVCGYFEAADTLVAMLAEAGFEEVRPPEGAFYVWARCEKVCKRLGVKGSTELCQVILERCLVAMTPGIDFDAEFGEHYVRFSVAGKPEDVREAGERILSFVREAELCRLLN